MARPYEILVCPACGHRAEAMMQQLCPCTAAEGKFTVMERARTIYCASCEATVEGEPDYLCVDCRATL
jgi:hypothetical protein